MNNPSIVRVFKFGGASVCNAEGIKNVAAILKMHANEKLIVVLSAMGKTTNSLEELSLSYYHKSGEAKNILSKIRAFHLQIIQELFPDPSAAIYDEVNNAFVEIEWMLEEDPLREFDFIYDQMVSMGEIIASKILFAYLKEEELNAAWLDVREIIYTDNSYREGKLDWTFTQKRCESILPHLLKKFDLVVCQGFIASTSENYTTTLGREGSDYSAAILAYCLDAKELVIWKDVPGLLNADPKFFKDTKKLDQVSYADAIELAYYGASVIHPKTIQPIQKKGIPLRVKSFLSPLEEGTVISFESQKNIFPSYIFKPNQILFSVMSNDFSFIAEEHLSEIFHILASLKIKTNLMQNSAISFSFCYDDSLEKTAALVQELSKKYKVLFNKNLTLYTIRHYDQATIEKLTNKKEILVEQKTRHTIQFLLKENESLI